MNEVKKVYFMSGEENPLCSANPIYHMCWYEVIYNSYAKILWYLIITSEYLSHVCQLCTSLIGVCVKVNSRVESYRDHIPPSKSKRVIHIMQRKKWANSCILSELQNSEASKYGRIRYKVNKKLKNGICWSIWSSVTSSWCLRIEIASILYEKYFQKALK